MDHLDGFTKNRQTVTDMFSEDNPYASPLADQTQGREARASEILTARFSVDDQTLRQAANRYLQILNNAEGAGSLAFLAVFVPCVILSAVFLSAAGFFVGSVTAIIVAFFIRDWWRRRSVNRLTAYTQDRVGIGAGEHVEMTVEPERLLIAAGADNEIVRPLAEAQIFGVYRRSTEAMIVLDDGIVIPIPGDADCGELLYFEFNSEVRRRIDFLTRPAALSKRIREWFRGTEEVG